MEVEDFGSSTLSCETTGQLISLDFSGVNYISVVLTSVEKRRQIFLPYFWCQV